VNITILLEVVESPNHDAIESSTKPCKGAITNALRVPEGTPLLTLDCVVYAIDGRPIEWRVARCHLRDNHYFAEMN